MKKQFIVIFIASAFLFSGIVLWRNYSSENLLPIKVGILHSLAGPMANSEKSLVDAVLMEIAEINEEKGGLLGRKIEAIVVDGKSDNPTFAREAERLITKENVSVIFGCWTSTCRRTVKPLFEKYNHLLIYPLRYEGLESSSNIIYTGASPNQQIIPAVKWSFDNLGKTFFLVGSDSVFPRTANEIIRDQINAIGGEIVGEEYLLLGNDDVDQVIQEIIKAQPEVILSTINGSSNIAFFRALNESGITAEKVPVMSFSITEEELRLLNIANMSGHYAAWNYFQSVETEKNRRFVKDFKNKYGQDRVTSDPIEAAYFGVYLWANAVREAETDDVHEVLKQIKKQSVEAPEGMVYVSSENNHTWKIARIGKMKNDGQFDVVYSSKVPVEPDPYPIYRSKKQWNEFLSNLYALWGGNWANPGISKDTIEKILIREEALVQTLASRDIIIATIEAATETNNTMSQDEIIRLDNEWQNAKKENIFSRQFLTNDAASNLLQFQKDNSQFKEIFATDIHGLNVAMTSTTSDYYQADEDWWQKSYNSGKGAVVHENLEYDKSAETWGIPLSIPAYNTAGKTVGIIKAFLDINELPSD